MPTYSASVTIAASPDAVFARVSDLATHGDWSADPLEVTAVADGRFRSSSRSKGKDITAELTVVEHAAPTRFVFDAEDLTGRWRHTFTLTDGAGSTTVRRDISGKLSGAQFLLYWLVVLPIKRPNAARALRALKETIESGAR